MFITNGELDTAGSGDDERESPRGGAEDRTIVDAGGGPRPAEASPTAPSTRRRGGPPRGLSRVGRYTILRVLGKGGMGVVLSGFDDELDRRVAIKLLWSEERAGSRERMQREAQALARLSHPNVVQVYEVGEHEGQLYVAMEYIQGRTLRAWLKRRDRPWPEVVRVFLQIGRGLAAAHDAGLIHRDIKPDNVLLGDDERARVIDFGLARAGDDVQPDAPPRGAVSGDSALLNSELTTASTILGTPAYMAPEQFLGRPTDARTDQFSFCAVLWEAVYRGRAFPGSSFAELRRAVTRGQRAPPMSGRGVPGWLHEAMARGLAVDPDERWPSMHALLEELTHRSARIRRRRVIAISLVSVALAGVSFAAYRYQLARVTVACQAEGATITEVWPGPGGQERARMRDAITRGGEGFARETADRLMPWLDRYVDAWSRLRSEACVDERVRGSSDPATRARVDWCLDERRFALAAFIEEFEANDPARLRSVVFTAARLPRVQPCGDVELQALRPAPPEDRREELRQLYADLPRASALQRAGQRGRALTLARQHLERALELGWAPATAAARLQLAAILRASADFDEARAQLERAYFEAAGSGARELEAEAADALAFLIGHISRKVDEGTHWSDLAAVPHGELDHEGVGLVTHLNTRAVLVSEDPARARELLERALEISERTLGAEHPSNATLLSNLSNVVDYAADPRRKIALLERAIEITERALGPSHPKLAGALNNLGYELTFHGEFDRARALMKRSIEVTERAFGPHHPDLVIDLVNYGDLLRVLGERDAAQETLERALEIVTEAHGVEHPDATVTLEVLARVHMDRGELQRARERLELAIETTRRARGGPHAELVAPLCTLSELHLLAGERELARSRIAEVSDVAARVLSDGDIRLPHVHELVARELMARGELEEAAPLLRSALAAYEKLYAPKHPVVAGALVRLAELELARGRGEAALERAERAYALCGRRDTPAYVRADALFALARARALTGEDSARVEELAKRARDAFAALGLTHGRDAVSGWIEARRAPGE